MEKVSHSEFMEIFDFCDTFASNDTDETIERRFRVLSEIHEALFGVPTKDCKIEDR